jgi:hypothetical protein
VVALSLWNWGLFWVALGGVVAYEALRRFVPSRRMALAALLLFPLAGLGGLLAAPSSLHRQWQTLIERGRYLKLPADHGADDELYAWARQDTPKDALFYYGSALFRYQGQRSITHSLADLINHRDSRYVGFYRRYRTLEAAFADPELLAREARDLNADYIVLEKKRPVRLYFPLSFENQKYLVYQIPYMEMTPSPQSPQSP